MLSIAFRAEGYDCLEAPTVAKGISIFSIQSPIWSFFDLGLPGGEGADVLSRIRQTSRVPVLVRQLRKKLDDHGCSSSFIENMPKKGYRFSHS